MRKSVVLVVVLSVLCLVVPALAVTPPSQSGSFGSNGSGDGQFITAIGVDVATNGDIYVIDQAEHRLSKFDSSGSFLTKGGADGVGAGQFGNAYDVAVDGSGNAYVTEVANDRVSKFNSNLQFVAAWGWGVSDGSAALQVCTVTCQAGISGSGAGQLSVPTGIAYDPGSGYLYVSNFSSGRIVVYDTSGNYIGTLGSNGSGNGQLSSPRGLDVNASGQIWVADTGNDRVSLFNADGTWVRNIGSHGAGDGMFDEPHDVAEDSSGDVYVIDWANSRIEKFDPSGTFLAAAGSVGSGTGQFNHPMGLALTAAENLLIVDTSNSRVVMYDSNEGQVDALIGPDGGPQVGENVYSAKGAGQTATIKVKKRTTATFDIQLQQEGINDDTIRWKGPSSVPGFKVRYFDGITDVTAQVTGTGYLLGPLPQDSAVMVSMTVKATKKASGVEAFLVKAISGRDPTFVDGVVARVKVI